MKKLLLPTILTNLILTSLLSILPGSSLLASEAIPTKTTIVRNSILETDITPYLESQDCGTQYQSSQEQLAQVQQELISTQDELVSTQDELLRANSQIDEAELLLSGTAIPDASSIDSLVAELFSLTKCSDCSAYNPNDPLIDQIHNGLIPYLQNSLANIGEFSRITQIAAGADHTVVLTANGKVYATGDNSYGQLGIGTDSDSRTTFTAMIGPDNTAITKIAAGTGFTVVLKEGKVYTTGFNNHGQLGIGTSDDQRTTLTAMTGTDNSDITDIAAGYEHTVVLKNDGTVYATGNNQQGQLGIGTNGDFKTTLTAMIGSDNTDITKIAAGDYHTIILKDDGTIYATGYNYYGQLGIDTSEDFRTTLTAMVGPNNENMINIAAGSFHSVALKDDGTVYATGKNNIGQLGTGTNGDIRTTLAKMIGLDNANITNITAGYEQTIVLKNDGTVYATGNNTYGQLGIGTNGDFITTLTNMIGQNNSNITNIAAGCDSQHTVVLKDDGATYVTGYNYAGQLGTGNDINTDVLTGIAKEAAVLYNFN